MQINPLVLLLCAAAALNAERLRTGILPIVE
jgi:hypothetical protein